MSKAKLLVVEDDPNLGDILKEYLEMKGYEPTLCRDGEEGWNKFKKDKFDLCLLDIMMPKKDGFTLAKEIKKVQEDLPILFLTAKNQKDDIIEGLKIGADDYLTKPFSMEELIVRIKAHLDKLRTRQSLSDWIALGKYEFHPTRQLLKLGDHEQPLTSRESQLLQILLQNANDITDRTVILNQIWGSDDFFNARSMDVFITKLRKKLQGDPSIQILNVRGYGFKLVC